MTKKIEKQLEMKDGISVDNLHLELVPIKRLLTLMLLKEGTPQSEVAKALCVDQSSVSRMFAGIKIKKLNALMPPLFLGFFPTRFSHLLNIAGCREHCIEPDRGYLPIRSFQPG